MQRREFRAMGTDVELLLDAEPSPETSAALRAGEAEFHRLEALLSRFRPGSELSRLNRDREVAAGSDLLRVTELAIDARKRTHGRFDPTVHGALLAAGYDQSFERIDQCGAPVAGVDPCGGHVRVDRSRGTIELADGVCLDLGGIAKGYACDRAREIMGRVGPCLANAGGDIAVSGLRAGGPWPIGVETSDGSVTLSLASGGLATSGSDRRRWRRGDSWFHHLVDPATGLPAETGLVRVTAVGRSAVEAEVAATSLFLAGAGSAQREADKSHIPAVLVRTDGVTAYAGGLG